MRNQSRSPFFIVEEFVSPLTCERIVDSIEFGFPETTLDGRPLPTRTYNKLVELRIADVIEEVLPDLEAYYKVQVKGVAPPEFEWYPEGCAATKPKCENSTYSNNRWTRVNNRDFVGILFLCDYQERAPFDPEFEVRGGKLQFPNHGFSFNPKRGMLVIFPGSPNFVNSVGKVEVGDLYQMRIPITTETPFVYNFKDYPGNYEEWFG
jgi:hypothetical protein